MVLERARGRDPERDAFSRRSSTATSRARPRGCARFLRSVGVATEFAEYGVRRRSRRGWSSSALDGVRGRNFIGAEARWNNRRSSTGRRHHRRDQHLGGKIVAWLIVPMFAVLVYEVIVRKFFRPTIWANDIATMCYGAHFFLAGRLHAATCRSTSAPISSRRTGRSHVQVKLDIAQYLLFFLPGMVMFTYMSWQFAAESWDLKESLMTTWRPPAYWYKTVIPVSSVLTPAAGALGGHQVLPAPCAPGSTIATTRQPS
jgi:TRAP-type mannitol/chloroaromatic compound transport system permease small subunit